MATRGPGLSWSQVDLPMSAHSPNAGPQKVCQMVCDWFAAQLALKDSDMHLRLFVDSLKPIVAG